MASAGVVEPVLSGTHVVRVWTSGDTKAKVALVDGSTESSLTVNGDDVWAWSSTKQEAVHSTRPESERKPSGAPTSPTEAITDLLDQLEPTTDVAVSGTGFVAGRAVYQLLLTPRDDASLVARVQVAVDAEHFVPLGLRVVADDGLDAVTVAATSIDFAVPADSIFDFQPPAGVTVIEPTDGATPAKPEEKPAAEPKTFGDGWASVVVLDVSEGQREPADPQAKVLLESLPEVSGEWGSGRLLGTVLVNAVITDDGRVAIGSVAPERLFEALLAK